MSAHHTDSTHRPLQGVGEPTGSRASIREARADARQHSSPRIADLLLERDRRHRPALHFDGPDAALSFQLDRLDALRTLVAGELLTPAAPLADALAQLAAVTRACRLAVAQMTDQQHTNS